MAHEHNERCKELQDALAAARARQSLPMRNTAVTGIQGIQTLDRGDTSPSADPDLGHDITNIEKELRDIGCEPR